MRCVVGLLAAAVMLGTVGGAAASVVVTIDKSQQEMFVSVDGAMRYSWPISTARAGYITPNGVYHPQRLARTWFSRRYYNSPMPYSIFFHGGYAIHGSYEISRLGGPASHGCVRLHPENAATLFELVQSYGMSDTRIVVTGATGSGLVARRQVPQPGYEYGSDDGFYARPRVPQPGYRERDDGFYARPRGPQPGYREPDDGFYAQQPFYPMRPPFWWDTR